MKKYKKQFDYWCKKFGLEFNKEMFDLYCWDQDFKKSKKMRANSKNCFEIMMDIVKYNDYPLSLSERYKKYKSYKPMSYTLERCQIRYGNKLGDGLFEQYRNKQAYSNSYEYKHKKYGWDENDFNIFNHSRAITLENMIKKYGKVAGKKKFEEYCQKQSYAGSKKDYFIEKYGLGEGLKKYDLMIEKKVKPMLDLLTKSSSNIEKEVIFELLSTECQFIGRPVDIIDENGNKSKIISYQFDVYDRDIKKHFIYDACILDKKIFLEFNGDLWHNNKRNNKVKNFLENNNSVIAKTIRKREGIDDIKRDVANKVGFYVYTIWEMDWKKDFKKIKEHFYNWIKNPRDNFDTRELFNNEGC